MSRNEVLPDGMSWYYNHVSKEFSLIVDKDCKYQNIKIRREEVIEDDLFY